MSGPTLQTLTVKTGCSSCNHTEALPLDARCSFALVTYFHITERQSSNHVSAGSPATEWLSLRLAGSVAAGRLERRIAPDDLRLEAPDLLN